MKRANSIFILVLMTVVVSFPLACKKQSGKYEAKATVDGLTMIFNTGQDPLTKGNNIFTLTIKDGTGKTVKAEDVSIRLYSRGLPTGVQPPDAGSQDMTLHATQKEESYTVEAQLNVVGEWSAEVSATQRDKKKPTVAAFIFNVE